MELLSWIALVLLALVGYAVGAVLARRSGEPDPDLLDVFAMLMIWVGAVTSRILVFDKWQAVGLWFVVAGTIGGILQLRKLQSRPTRSRPVGDTIRSFDPIVHERSENILRRLWQSWRWFALKVGAFQSGLLLMLFYFVIVTPFGVGLRAFGDPLRMKRAGSTTFWQSRTDPTPTRDEARRQF